MRSSDCAAPSRGDDRETRGAACTGSIVSGGAAACRPRRPSSPSCRMPPRPRRSSSSCVSAAGDHERRARRREQRAAWNARHVLERMRAQRLVGADRQMAVGVRAVQQPAGTRARRRPAAGPSTGAGDRDAAGARASKSASRRLGRDHEVGEQRARRASANRASVVSVKTVASGPTSTSYSAPMRASASETSIGAQRPGALVHHVGGDRGEPFAGRPDRRRSRRRPAARSVTTGTLACSTVRTCEAVRQAVADDGRERGRRGRGRPPGSRERSTRIMRPPPVRSRAARASAGRAARRSAARGGRSAGSARPPPAPLSRVAAR